MDRASSPPLDLDPYAAPRSDLFGQRTAPDAVWRSGALVCMEKGAALPARCVRCNQPAEASLDRKLYWLSSWWLLTIFAGVLVYGVIALIVRKRADVAVRLCARHARARRRNLALAWVVGLGWIPAFLVLPTGAAGFVALAGTLAGVVALIVGNRQASVLRAHRIDEREIRLAGAGEAFLESLEQRAA